MAKKETPKPIIPLKHDFVPALENFMEQSMLLYTTVDSLVRLGAINEGVLPKLQERLDAWKAAWSHDDE